MAKSKVAQATRAPKRRTEKPVSEGILRAAARAGVEPTKDNAAITMMRGDLVMAGREIQGAFDEVLAASLCEDGGEHDMLVLGALRRLRNARNIVQGGVS